MSNSPPSTVPASLPDVIVNVRSAPEVMNRDSPLADDNEVMLLPTPSPGASDEEAHHAEIIASIEGHNPPALATFAAAVAEAQRRTRSNSNANAVAQQQQQQTPKQPSPEDFSTGASAAGLKPALKRPSLLQRQPSAPHLAQWDTASNSSASPAAPLTEHRHVSFFDSTTTVAVQRNLTESPGMQRGYTAPTSKDAEFMLDEAAVQWDPQAQPSSAAATPIQFNHLAQRPSSQMFGGGGGSNSNLYSSSSASPAPARNSLHEPLLNESPAPSDADHHALERELHEKRAAANQRHSLGLGRRQLVAMLRKNWLLKKRNPGQFLCEILSPLLMVMVIVGGWIFSLDHVQNFADETFANETIIPEIFDWVLDHIEPIPQYHGSAIPILQSDELTELHSQHRLINRFAHRHQALRTGANDTEPTSLSAMLVAPEWSSDTSELSYAPMGVFSHLRADDHIFPIKRAVSVASAPSTPHVLPSEVLQASHPHHNATCFPITALPGKQFCYNTSEADILEHMLNYNGPMHIPTFDEYVMAHFVLQYLLNNTQHTFEDLQNNLDRLDQFTNGRLSNLIWLGKLIFAPDTPAVRQLVHRLNETYSTFGTVFTGVAASEDAAVALSSSNVHTDRDRTWAVLVFDQLALDQGMLDVTVRMNSSVLPATKGTIDKYAKGIDSDYKKYIYSGFLTLQIMLEELALNVSSGGDDIDGSQAQANVRFNDVAGIVDDDVVPLNPSYVTDQRLMTIPFPVLHYRGNPFYDTVGPLIGLVLCMSMLYPTSRLIKGIVEEKETRMKETMLMMGLKTWVFNGSWFLTFLVQFLLTSSALVVLVHFTIFPLVSPSLLFVFFNCFFMSQITLGFLITCFFSRAKLAGILGPILLFAATMPRYAFYSTDADAANSSENRLAKTVVSLLAPTAFTFGTDLIVQYENANLSLQWSNLADDPFSMARVLIFLLVDFLLYALLAWYLDRVMPNEYGQRASCLFCCQKAYWTHGKLDYSEEEEEEEADQTEPSKPKSDDDAVIEPVPSSMHRLARVHIKKLRKQFTEGRGRNARTTTAVNGLDLTLYEGQITSLLGHNGAGKSTTISMLTGLIVPTSGDCSIHGFSILRNMKEIRKSLGVCPQINVQWPKISVQEHLELYAVLKGVKPDEVQHEVAEKIAEVGLEDKKHYYSSALSGGMQRKLQVAMAFIGGSKVVFLDEPTSGMDPYSRRSTWTLLRKMKAERVIVLTTHFMDEADLLGDRIAIMSEGRLRCCGSSLFLKSHYGIGYNLTLVKASRACRTEQVAKMVMFFIPEAKVLSTAGGEMSFRLPHSSVKAFPGLFQQLEERRDVMHIGGYGISQTTLEEVFMRCAQISDASNNAASPKDEDETSEEGRRARKSNATIATMPNTKTGKTPSPPAPTAAPGTLKAPKTPQARRGSDIQTRTRPEEMSLQPVRKLTAPLDTSLPPSAEAPPVAGPNLPRMRHRATLMGQFAASFQKRVICALRDLKGRFFEVVLPVLVVALVLLILQLNGPETPSNLLMKAELYSGSSVLSPMWFTTPATRVLEPSTLYSFQHARGLPSNVADSLFVMKPAPYSDSQMVTDALLATYTLHEGHRYGALVFNDSVYTHFDQSNYASNDTYVEHIPLTVMHNTTFFHCLPVLVAEVAQARWNANRWRAMQATGVDIANGTTPLPQVIYQLRNHPLPSTSNQSLRTRTYLNLFASLFILIPFCYLPASFVLFVVKERSVKSKHLQFVSGLNPNIYWLATYAFDVLNYLVVAVAVMCVMLAFRNAQFTGTLETAASTFLMFLQYGLAAIPLAYCYSFFFGNYTSAQVGIAGLNFLTGFVLVTTSFMFDNISSTKEANHYLKPFYRVFPPFTLGEGLINLATSDLLALIHGRPKPSPFEWKVAGRGHLYLLCEMIGFMFITLALESSFLHRLVRSLFNLSGDMADAKDESGTLSPREEEDEDVAAERRRVNKIRVRVIKQTSEGHYAYSDLASPMTPGRSLASYPNTNDGPAGRPVNAAHEQDWSISLNSAASPGSAQDPNLFSVVVSPVRNSSGELAQPLLQETQWSVDTTSVPASAAVNARSPLSHTVQPDLERQILYPPLASDADQSHRSQSSGGGSSAAYSTASSDGMPSHQPEQQDVLLIQRLRKVYPARGGGKTTVAVRNLSLGIPRGQVFGFLGINGAGKTTTMKMLTGDIPISKGRAYINGFSLVKQLDHVRKELGYCPQWDPLLPDQTARETLTMYAKIHGLPSAEIPHIVSKLLNNVGLKKFADRVCGPFSGGNKRKLSLAIALIGNPSVVFLDEPSTGMDPVSRRFMWGVISEIADGRSVILTTHAMEECEALCQRVGIMVSGALRCLGSVQHLKSRYGQGYLMEINAAESAVPKVRAFMAKLYPGATLDEVHAGRMKWSLPQKGLTLSSVFSAMEAHKKSLQVVDYAISQCSLESIFLSRVASGLKEDHKDDA